MAQGGSHPEGGMMRQIPAGSATGRMLREGRKEVRERGWKVGCEEVVCKEKDARKDLRGYVGQGVRELLPGGVKNRRFR